MFRTVRHATRVVALVATLALFGCAGRTSTGELLVPEPPAQAYAKAVKTTMAVGGSIRTQDKDAGTISATTQGGFVALNVLVTPHDGGSKIEVLGSMPSNYIQPSPFTLAERWLATYQGK